MIITPPSSKQAFSLVELSIVLVILGLLVGGVLSGQSLIRAAELRSVSADYQRYSAAVMTFRDKYFAIPGDMTNATRFWGDDNAVCADAAIPNGTPGTCSGNGDGNVMWGSAANQTAEIYQFWKQLALSGLIEGSYSGLSGSGGVWHAVGGQNAPSGKISTSVWSSATLGVNGNADLYALDYGSIVFLGGQQSTGNAAPIFRPEEAWNIDTKMDDGRPAYGKVVARYWNNLCAAADDGTHANNDLNASYRFTDNSLQCAIYFRNAF